VEIEKSVTAKNKAMPPAVISGAPEEVLRTDIKIPYVILGQGLSDAVVSKDVAVGDIFRSSNKEILGNPQNPIDVIFLHYPQAMWVIEYKAKGSDRWKYKGTIPRDAKNETLPWSYFADENGIEFNGVTGKVYEEGEKGALPWRRTKQLRVFAILAADLKAAVEEIAKADKGELPDPSKALTPVVLSFRSSGYDAGKEICTFTTRAMSMKQPVWRYVVQLGVFIDKNDDGVFSVWRADTSKPVGVDKIYLETVQEWATLVNTRADKIQTDESALN
jgi:hypothetical protein